jgi:hypothetical protein
MHKVFTIALAIVALIGATSNARLNGNSPLVIHVVNGAGYPPLVSLNAAQRGPLVARDDSGDAGLTKIVSNFTQYAESPYWGRLGYAVIGPESKSAEGTEQWLATAFTPKANHLATKVEVPVKYYSGTNGVTVSIYDDAGGVPGKALHTWELTNLPSTPCCTVGTVSYKRGVPLTGGKQYWIVVGTNAKYAASVAIWTLTEFARTQQKGSTWATYCSGNGCSGIGIPDNTWKLNTGMFYGFAYAVLGT